jgi:hypothetical protein
MGQVMTPGSHWVSGFSMLFTNLAATWSVTAPKNNGDICRIRWQLLGAGVGN